MYVAIYAYSYITLCNKCKIDFHECKIDFYKYKIDMKMVAIASFYLQFKFMKDQKASIPDDQVHCKKLICKINKHLKFQSSKLSRTDV